MSAREQRRQLNLERWQHFRGRYLPLLENFVHGVAPRRQVGVNLDLTGLRQYDPIFTHTRLGVDGRLLAVDSN